MDVNSAGETVSVTDGVVQIAFDLSGSNAGYLLISVPEAGPAENEFYGHSHYVEVKDQIFGRYGGMRGITWDTDGGLEISLLEAVPDVGPTLKIKAGKPMSKAVTAELRRVQSTLNRS